MKIHKPIFMLQNKGVVKIQKKELFEKYRGKFKSSNAGKNERICDIITLDRLARFP
jgi:hypothetical protein